jgi:DinB family protein
MSISTAVGHESRILNEGYGPGAWHGADLKAALASTTPARAFWRPGDGRHNVAEIALHHAFCARSVWSRISGQTASPFILDGEDWFDVPDERTLSWPAILTAVAAEQERLGELIARVESGQVESPLTRDDRFGLVLGITCHAIYHAGQIQLINVLRGK